MKNSILKYLSFGTMAVIILAMIAATVLERLHGTQEAFRWVYHNPVFMILWAVAALSGLFYLLGKAAWKRPFTFLLHVSFLFILAGALVTFLFGESGVVSLREGEEKSAFELDDGGLAALPFSIRLESFDIDYYPESRMPRDYRSAVTFLPEGEQVQISMNHIAKYGGYRFYQADYDEDLDGSILAVSHDPWGVGVTYTGYILLLIAMLGFFFQKDTPFRAALGRAGEAARQSPRRKYLQWAVWAGAALALGLWVFITVKLGVRWYQSGTGPFVGRYNVMMLMAWFSTLFVVLLFRKFPLIEPLGLLLAGFTMLLAFRSGGGTQMPLMPVLRSPLLYIHVVSMMLSYTLFGLVALNGIVGVCVPSADTRERLRDVSLAVLYPGVFLLTFGTFLGAVWANISWGSYWAWDPKETWALVTLLVYSFTLHGDALKPFRNARFFHWFAILAFLSVLITYFGVNLILGGMHSYA